MKISKSLLLIGIMILLLTGCDSDKNTVVSNGEKVNTSKMGHKHCTREATAGTGIDVSLNYDIYYNGEDINLLHSEEKVISANSADLDKYEEAYKKIQENYKDLEYYDAKVERGDTTVISTMIINYEKINIKQLLAIEGEEDNIIVDGKAKLDKWLELSKKFGTKCEEVSDEA